MMKKFQGLILALVVSLPLVANARITREDLELYIPYSADLIGQLRACSKFDQESMRYDNAARDTELALYKYIRASSLMTNAYPDGVVGKASVMQQVELGQLQLHQRTDPGEIPKVCQKAELSARRHIVLLLEGIDAHLRGKKK